VTSIVVVVVVIGGGSSVITALLVILAIATVFETSGRDPRLHGDDAYWCYYYWI